MPFDANKRKRKAYYRKCAAGAKRQHVDGETERNSLTTPKSLLPGMIGYLVTCNRNERFAVMEVFRLLNDALKRLSPASFASDEIDGSDNSVKNDCSTTQTPEKPLDVVDSAGDDNCGNTVDSTHGGGDDDEDDDDILTQLRMENAGGEPNSKSDSALRYSFYSTRSGVSNCLFIVHYAESVSPNTLVHSIFEHVLRTQVMESRHLLRVLPVAATCHASAPELVRCVRVLWTAFLGRTVEPEKPSNVDQPEQVKLENEPSSETAAEKQQSKPVNSGSIHTVCPRVPLPHAQQKTLDGPKTFLVSFKARNYDRLSRDTAFESTVSAVRDVDASWRICPVNPSVVIFVNVLRNVACISLLEDFTRFRKYNLAELISPTTTKPESPTPEPTKDQ